MPVSMRNRVVGDTPAIDAAARADGVQLLPNPGSKIEPAFKPYWTSECGRAVVYVGDCRDVMARMEPEQFHAVVTDPPYGLEFMGKAWDAPWKNDGNIETCDEGTDASHPFRDGAQHVRYGNRRTRKVDARQHRAAELDDPVKAKYLRHNIEYVRDSYLYQTWFLDRAEAMLHVAKPGAHLLSFGGTRMWHRMACAVEDAGWDIRDTVMWVYGSGFPKSHDASKAIDKVLGAERESNGGVTDRRDDGTVYGIGHSGNLTSNEAVTDAARQWSGFGTALKPSHEPVILARKPMPGTVAQCVLENGTGALNIDGCRVGDRGETQVTGAKTTSNCYGVIDVPGGKVLPSGRWPANLIHDGSDEVVELFPETSSARQEVTSKPGTIYGMGAGLPSHTGVYGFNDSGSAARFFYTTKADESDRPHGKGATSHPTVKPLDLMRYLVRLVCARGGTVLDPFMGSGSTGCAAIAEGMRFVGIEQSQEYADIAVGRLRLALQSAPEMVEVVTHGGVKVVRRSEQDTPPPPRKLRG